MSRWRRRQTVVIGVLGFAAGFVIAWSQWETGPRILYAIGLGFGGSVIALYPVLVSALVERVRGDDES